MKHSNQSPKYPLRWKDLRYVLTPKRLEEKWKNKTRYHARKQFFPDILDFSDYHVHIDQHIKRIRKNIQNGSYTPFDIERYRVEKTKGLCRLMVNPHPFDLLILQCLSDTLYNQIKKAAPSENAFFEPQDHSFANLNGVEPEYDTFKAWKEFLNKILGFQKDSKFIVVTDIANYYDFIDFNNLRNVISAHKQVNETLMDFLIYILRGLSWQPDFMPLRATGLPQIDADAPRLLAHAYLFELDAFIESKNKKRYARFMDDIDAGVDSLAEGKALLRDIDLVLQSRNLRLNSGKTIIMSSKESIRHFRVKENIKIEKIDNNFKLRIKEGKPIKNGLIRLANICESMHKRGEFDDGNGEKVLKRIIGILNNYGQPISSDLFSTLISRRPNMRVSALRNASVTGFGSAHFAAIFQYMESGLATDDAFQMNLIKSLVSAKLIYDGSEVDNIKKLVSVSDKISTCGAHSIMWLASRFCKFDSFIRLAKSALNESRLSYSTYRLIGANLARVLGTSDAQQLRMFVSEIQNRDAESAFEFIFELNHQKIIPAKLYSIIKAPNPTAPMGTSHQKMFLIRPYLKNANVKTKDRIMIEKIHNYILSEESYANNGLY